MDSSNRADRDLVMPDPTSSRLNALVPERVYDFAPWKPRPTVAHFFRGALQTVVLSASRRTDA